VGGSDCGPDSPLLWGCSSIVRTGYCWNPDFKADTRHVWARIPSQFPLQPRRTRPGQVESDQVGPDRVESNRTKSNQVESAIEKGPFEIVSPDHRSGGYGCLLCSSCLRTHRSVGRRELAV